MYTVQELLDWWNGERAADGVMACDSWKCKFCQFVGECPLTPLPPVKVAEAVAKQKAEQDEEERQKLATQAAEAPERGVEHHRAFAHSAAPIGRCSLLAGLEDALAESRDLDAEHPLAACHFDATGRPTSQSPHARPPPRPVLDGPAAPRLTAMSHDTALALGLTINKPTDRVEVDYRARPATSQLFTQLRSERPAAPQLSHLSQWQLKRQPDLVQPAVFRYEEMGGADDKPLNASSRGCAHNCVAVSSRNNVSKTK
eukprot:Selendium_serpulae@DN648_c0_g1_i2.p1